MDTKLVLTSQLLQAILVASSALAGFTGLLIIEFSRLARKTRSWDKWVIGFISLICGISFVFCVTNAKTWFDDQLVYNLNSQFTFDFSSELNNARVAFNVQVLSFFMLFLVYIAESFFSHE
jgi:hypothetical protein